MSKSGIMHFYNNIPNAGEDACYFDLRWGEATIPDGVKDACTDMVFMQLIETDIIKAVISGNPRELLPQLNSNIKAKLSPFIIDVCSL